MNTIKLIKPFLKSNIPLFSIYLFFALLTYPLESLVIPSIFGSFFSSVKTKGSNYKTFFLKAIFFTLVINLANTTIAYLDSIVIPSLNEYIVNQIYKKLLLSYQYEYQDLELGKIISRINTLPGIIRELTTDFFNWLLPRALSIIITNIYFLYVSPQLGFVSIGFLGLIMWYNYYYSYTCVKLSESRYKKYEERAEKTQDKLSNLFSIYSSANIQGEINKYEKTNAKYKNSYSKTILCSSKIKFVNNFIQCLIFIILNVMIIHFYKSDKIEFSKMISLIMIVSYYIPCISTLMKSIPDYTNHVGIINSIEDFLARVNKKIKNKKPITVTNGLIQIRNLKFSHDKKNIFNKFNLEISPKTHLGIIGESGNGKSTLVKLIMGYFPVENKTIYIDDQDINKYSIESIRSQIIYLNQNTKLFNETIYYNIKYANDLTEEQIDQLTKKFNLKKIFENLENGFKTIVGVNGDKLSGGQKQIVQLLRCYGLAKQVKIAIFDEPTASVDPKTKQAILNIIKDLTKDCTSIMITHDISNLSICDRVIKISQGEIVEDKQN
jgi:ABC-type multidrug transport system fused ATPase/permease subunit